MTASKSLLLFCAFVCCGLIAGATFFNHASDTSETIKTHVVKWVDDTMTEKTDDCRYEEEATQEVDARGARSAMVIAKAGTLRIEGRSGISKVTIHTRACATNRDLLEDTRLRADRRGNEVRIEADVPRSRWNQHAKLDMIIEVPNNMILDVDDSSGHLEIRNVASLDLDDSSGGIVVENVAGDLKIDDSSGHIEVSDVDGRLDIDDSSGNIDVYNVRDAVNIDDSSGGVEVERVGGDVTVRDSSGSINVRDIRGDFRVPSDGSGSIRYTDVAGSVDIPAKKRRGR